MKIYGVPRSRAIRTLWMAHELGIPYELIEVKVGAEGSRKPEYVALNPNGQVPFIDDDGLVLWESLMINLYLARKHGGPLAPTDVREEGLMMMWSAWAMNQIEPHASQAQYHGVMLPEAERIPALVTQGLASVQAPLAVLEGALVKGGGTLVGGRFTVADLNMACVMFYLRFFPQALAGKPAIKAWYDAAMARPANRAAFALRGE